MEGGSKKGKGEEISRLTKKFGYCSKCKWTVGSGAAGSHHGSQLSQGSEKNWVSLGGSRDRAGRAAGGFQKGFGELLVGFRKSTKPKPEVPARSVGDRQDLAPRSILHGRWQQAVW